MKLFVFCKMPKKGFDKFVKELRKNHSKDYLDKILTHDGTNKTMLIYDEDCQLTGSELDLLALNGMAFSAYIGVMLKNRNELSNLRFWHDHEVIEWNRRLSTDFDKAKAEFIEGLTIDSKIMIKKALAKRHFLNTYQNANEKQIKCLEEVLRQITVCEDFGCGLSETQIQAFIDSGNEAKVSIKVRTLIKEKLSA